MDSCETLFWVVVVAAVMAVCIVGIQEVNDTTRKFATMGYEQVSEKGLSSAVWKRTER